MADALSGDTVSDTKTHGTRTETRDSSELGLVDRWWRAANYLSVGQIYLRSNPLLREPLRAEDAKSRLLGHWGTTPGLNFVYAHLNRVIRRDRQEMLFIAGPGHGGPAVVANAWLEGTYSELYPDKGEDEEGMPASQVTTFQTMAPISAPKITASSIALGEMIPVPMVAATCSPKTAKAMKLKKAAQATA